MTHVATTNTTNGTSNSTSTGGGNSNINTIDIYNSDGDLDIM